MVNVVNLLGSVVKAPTGLWETILNWIESSVLNYGWVIILFTLLVKVCLSPLDLLMKFSSKKSTLVQQKCAPQIARINKKYANDRNAAQLQTQQVYKKEGYNMYTSCIVMILNLAITLTVFLTLFNSLREMSAYKAILQYDALQTSYVQTYEGKLDEVYTNFEQEMNKYTTIIYTDGETQTEEALDYQALKANFELVASETNPETETETGIFHKFFGINVSDKLVLSEQSLRIQNASVKDAEQNTVTIISLLTNSGKIAANAASDSATETWAKVKEKWLWIDNIWVAETYKSPLPTYDDLASMAKSSKNAEYQKYINNTDKTLYNVITNSVDEQSGRWNGYFIIAILAGVTSFLSQWISEKMSKPKNKQVSQYVDQANPQANGTMKFMKILLPAMMVIFVLTSSAAFGLYIVASSIISIGISALTTVIVDACYKKKQAEVDEFLYKQVEKSVRKSKRGLKEN